MSQPTRVPLGEVLRLRNEIVHPRDHPRGTGLFVGLEHIEPNTGRQIGSLPIDLANLTGRKARFRTGDIVYGYLRPYLNKVWLAEFDGYCSVDQYVFTVDPRVDAMYVALYMRSPAFLAEAPVDLSPGQLPRIRTEELLSTAVPLPSLDEQRRVAARLSDQLAAVETLRGAARSRLGLEDALTMMVLDDQVDALRSLPSEALGKIVHAPGSIADGPFGSHLKTEHYRPSGVRVIRLQNIGSGQFLDQDRAYVSPTHAQGLARHDAQRRDVVVAALGDGARPAGRACLVPDDIGPAIVKADCFRIRPPKDLLQARFLMHYLNSSHIRRLVREQMRGATRPRVTLEILRRIPIPILTAEEQASIVRRIDEQQDVAGRLKNGLIAELHVIDALPAALLRRAFAVTV